MFGVGAREFGELFVLLGMALSAGVSENFTHGHLQGGMGIGVALQAICKLLAMRRFGMAAEALGHDLRPIVFDRVVGMELLMTPMAVEPMLAAGFLEIPENADMTLAALGYGKWWRFHGIKIASTRLFLPARRIGMTIVGPTLTETEGGGDEQKEDRHDPTDAFFHGPTYLFRLWAMPWHWPHLVNLAMIPLGCGTPWQSVHCGTVPCLS